MLGPVEFCLTIGEVAADETSQDYHISGSGYLSSQGCICWRMDCNFAAAVAGKVYQEKFQQLSHYSLIVMDIGLLDGLVVNKFHKYWLLVAWLVAAAAVATSNQDLFA